MRTPHTTPQSTLGRYLSKSLRLTKSGAGLVGSPTDETGAPMTPHTRVLSSALTAAVGAALLVGTTPSEAAEIVIVPNPTFATSTTGWTATSNATIKRIVDDGATS